MNLAEQVRIEETVQKTGDLCAEYAKNHGKENPDLILNYGRALFEAAKASASLLEQQNVDSKQLPLENPKVKIIDETEGSGEEPEEPKEEQKEEPKEEPKDEPKDEPKGDSKEDEPKEDQEEDDADSDAESESEPEDDFVNAFQVVDVARVLYSKLPESKETLSKLIETRMLLGDISLEDDNPTQAIEDYQSACELAIKLHTEKSKQFVQSAFMLSIAYESTNNIKSAHEWISKAVSSAKSLHMESLHDLELKQSDLESELTSSHIEDARQTTKDGISGRSAIKSAVNNLVSNANDISQLTRKRRRTK